MTRCTHVHTEPHDGECCCVRQAWPAHESNQVVICLIARGASNPRPVSNTMQTRALACVRLNRLRRPETRARKEFKDKTHSKAPRPRANTFVDRACGRNFSRLFFCRDDVDELLDRQTLANESWTRQSGTHREEHVRTREFRYRLNFRKYYTWLRTIFDRKT